ncbi:hypothetical protein DBZ36_00660 [Alginatibacterium sediminis]|uniref:Uncharacterized protein n=1 Tax=Alginatibacterium sediminis TaxID=2164068 RepID=A0A420ENC7_9ALTE|nr:hypothetical protein DBZ36_00660 [Alginatibacterium sediminis]
MNLIWALFRPILTSLWNLSVLYGFWVIAWVYSAFIQTPMYQFDEGVNAHKFAIVVLYILYICLWKWLNCNALRLYHTHRT